MQKLKEMWQRSGRLLFIVLTGILFYELLEHISVVKTACSYVIGVLRPIFVGIGIAYVVNIPSTLLQRTVFKRSEGKRWAIIVSNLIAYLFVAGLVALIALLIVPKAADGVRMLFNNIENYYNGAVSWATEFWQSLKLSDEATAKAVEIFSSIAAKIEGFLTDFIPRLLDYTFATVNIIANALLAVAFSIYCLAEKRRLLAHSRRFIRAVFSGETSARVLDLCTYANDTFRSYITGQLIGSAILGVFCYIGMRIFGMPYAEMISVIVAALALIPIIGNWISTIACALIILVASPDNPMLAFWFVVMIFIIQQVSASVINPRIVGSKVGLSSAWVLLGIIVGGGFFGVRGLLLAVPVTAVLYRLCADWTNERAKKKGVPIVESVPASEHASRKKRRRDGEKRRPFFSARTEAKPAKEAAAEEKPAEEAKETKDTVQEQSKPPEEQQ